MLPEAQGRGIGAALLDSVLDGAGPDRAWLVVTANEAEARRFYRKRAWIELAEDRLGSDEPRVVMGRELR